eukprot:1753323-Pyramimonas_sp.AAC.1
MFLEHRPDVRKQDRLRQKWLQTRRHASPTERGAEKTPPRSLGLATRPCPQRARWTTAGPRYKIEVGSGRVP